MPTDLVNSFKTGDRVFVRSLNSDREYHGTVAARPNVGKWVDDYVFMDGQWPGFAAPAERVERVV